MDRILLRYTENTEAYESRNNEDVARVSNSESLLDYLFCSCWPEKARMGNSDQMMKIILAS